MISFLNKKYRQRILFPIIISLLLLSFKNLADSNLNSDFNTILRGTIKEENLEKIKEITDALDLNAVFQEDETLIYEVAETGNLYIFKYFVEKGVKIEEISQKVSNYCHDFLNSISHRLSSSSTGFNMPPLKKPSVYQIYHRNLLFAAAISGNLELFKYIEDETKIDIMATDTEGNTLLFFAAQSGSINLVKYLIEEKQLDYQVENNYGETIFPNAGVSGNLPLIRYLVEDLNMDMNKGAPKRYTPFSRVIASGNLDAVKYLVSKGADITLESLYVAIITGKKSLDIIKYLMSFDIQLNKLNDKRYDYTSFLLGATVSGNMEMLEFVLDNILKYAYDQIEYFEAMGFVVARNDLEMLEYLIAKGANINSRAENNENLLHHIATSERDMNKTLKYLLDNGIDLNATNNDGNTPLHLAAFHGNLQIIKLLVENGAKINLKNNKGYTPYDEMQSFSTSASKYLKSKGGKHSMKYLINNIF